MKQVVSRDVEQVAGSALVVLVALVLASVAAAQDLGTRVYRMGGDAQFFADLGSPFVLGPWQGSLTFVAGEPDEDGHAAVTGGGLIWVDILDGGRGRSCRRFDACSGTLSCNGGVNVDVSATHDSEGCQGVVNGSGNLPDVSVGVGADDSGPGAMLLTCMVAEANFTTEGAQPDCAAVPDGDGVESYGSPRPIVFTTGANETIVIDPCLTLANSPRTAGAPFRCEDWPVTGSGGILVATMISEEQDEVSAFDIGLGMLLEDSACGNAMVDLGEACDAGGSTTGCDADCTLVRCGDGFVNPAAGEACEADADCGDEEICAQGCQCIAEPVCLDGEVGEREACDDGEATAFCDADCTLPMCGDGLLNTSAGEACEEDEACGAEQRCGRSCACVAAQGCPNGFVDEGEQCDDGNDRPGDGCSPACEAELPFRLELANLNLLHDVFEDNDLLDRLRLTAESLAARPPDILTLQEVAFVDGVDAHQILIDLLEQQHGLVYHGVKYGETAAGQAVLSRWPVELREVEVLPSVEEAEEFPDRRFFGRVVVHAPPGPLDVYGLHFCAGSQGCDNDLRLEQTHAMLHFVVNTRESDHPTIVGADFNAHTGSPPDANPEDDDPIALLRLAGLRPLLDGFDAPCNAPLDASGCTSSQELFAAVDTTTRRIDNIMVGGQRRVSQAIEVGPSETFADAPGMDANPECVLSEPVACQLGSQCPPGHVCERSACVDPMPACDVSTDCMEGAVCRDASWPSDHHGVRTAIELHPLPEPGAALQGVALLAGLAGLRRIRPRPASAQGASERRRER